MRHFSIYGLETLDTSPFVILIKKQGSNKISRERRLPVTQALQVKSSEKKKKKTAARVPEPCLLPEISLGRECPRATCGVEHNPLKLSSKWWLESSRKVIKWRRELWGTCSWHFCLFYNSWHPWGKKSCSELNNTTSLHSNRGKFSSHARKREKIYSFDSGKNIQIRQLTDGWMLDGRRQYLKAWSHWGLAWVFPFYFKLKSRGRRSANLIKL